MFSILVCSVNASYLERLKLNIQKTIGSEYELLVWDNLSDPRPITEVYNLLAERAQYPYWCFIHEDICFDTNKWSDKLLEAFQQHPETGLIGIAGSKYKSKTASGWSTGIKKFDCCNIYHQDRNNLTQHIYMNPAESLFEPVANVDGVFMAIRREVWKHARFNDKLLKGFHLYDIDFSFQVLKNWQAAVVFNISIMHFTQGGNFGDDWVEYTLKWHHDFSNELPQAAAGVQIKDSFEREIGLFWLKRLATENISWKNKLRWIKAGNHWKHPKSWPYIGIFLAAAFFKKADS